MCLQHGPLGRNRLPYGNLPINMISDTQRLFVSFDVHVKQQLNDVHLSQQLNNECLQHDPIGRARLPYGNLPINMIGDTQGCLFPLMYT